MAVHQHIKVISDFVTKRLIKQFANKFNLVYFGHVSPRDEDYELVRGSTVSTTHIDNHYTVGTIDGRDVILVERSNTLRTHGRPTSKHNWLILQLDLKQAGLPHVFIDFHQHDETFYSSLFAKLPRFQDLTHIFGAHDSVFIKHCKVFGYPQQYVAIGHVLPRHVTATLTQHFRQFDYEIHDDRLYIYASKTRPTVAGLQDMVRVGTWLAEQLDDVVIS